MSERVNQILLFWFGNSFEDEFPPRYVSDKWYSFYQITDEYIRNNFLVDIEYALSGKYDHWADTAKGRLALIILLDQFTRHIYRHTPLAFSGDKKALALVHNAIHLPMGADLLTCEKIFYFGPLEHSEKLSDQIMHMNIYEKMIENLPQPVISKLEYYLYWFIVHYKVVKDYGRFPWRNDILGRKSTKKEKEYLKNAPDFGQNYNKKN